MIMKISSTSVYNDNNNHQVEEAVAVVDVKTNHHDKEADSDPLPGKSCLQHLHLQQTWDEPPLTLKTIHSLEAPATGEEMRITKMREVDSN